MQAEMANFASGAATSRTLPNARIVFDSRPFAASYENMTSSTDEDRATATCNLYRTFGEIWTCSF